MSQSSIESAAKLMAECVRGYQALEAEMVRIQCLHKQALEMFRESLHPSTFGGPPPSSARPPAAAQDRPGGPQGTLISLLPEPEPVALAAVAALADHLFPGQGFAQKVRSFRRVYPVSWISLALSESAAWVSPPKTFVPVRNLLESWRAFGPPVPREPDRSQATPDIADSDDKMRAMREAMASEKS